MRRINKSAVLWAAGCYLVLSLSGCGGPTTPDTEGQTLAEARLALRDAGMTENNIRVTGERGDPDALVVCDHDPDGVSPSEPATLEVATVCPVDDHDEKVKKESAKKSKG